MADDDGFVTAYATPSVKRMKPKRTVFGEER